MPTTNRSKDTFDYLLEQSKIRNNWLTAIDIKLLQNRVHECDLIDGGSDLSLGWSWYNSRPAKDVRRAIRAFVMISIYNGEIKASGAASLATALKSKDETSIHNDLKTKIKDFCSKPTIKTVAVEYTRCTKGAGQSRTKAKSIALDGTVTQIMARYSSQQVIAVMLIDMQNNGNVDAKREHDGKSVLGHMQDVLDAAKKLKFVVYDIVVDPKATGNVKTIPQLVGKMPDETKNRAICKPSYNSFQNTSLAEMLTRDKIQTIIVMGTDANLCVKNTIFGTPEFEESTDETRPMTEQERDKFTIANPQFKALSVQDFNSVKSLSVTKKVDYIDGLLDRGLKVITSRSILESTLVLENDYVALAGI